MKMQNLVSRAIEPVSKAVVAAALLQIPASGLEIRTPAEGVYTASNPIPVDVNTPSGLVYRVQVGAFAKPIPQELFREFNPVSGEKLNSGITRYMAGYFNSETKVMEARNEIRTLGYADAFPVAYCDGKRISIAEARQLEASGACVPKGENQLMMEVAMNTVQKVDPQMTGNYVNTNVNPLDLVSAEEDTSRRRKPQIDVSYNKAPGAAKAEAIELKKGLFFTVQIGVYNKPVSSATLFNLEPYMSLRLPNGQIRYSTGIFHSIDEARPRKQEAINAGVKDAFITAYYNGERITLADAAKLLSERGTAVLEPKDGQAATFAKETEPIKTGVSPEVVRNPDVVTKPTEYLQIVTKKQFSEFPSDVLNRYNSHGSFYFDATDGRVKSVIVDSDEDLPQVHYFRNDVDTVRFKESNEFTKGTIVCLTFAEGALPGDLIDWILRQNYRKEYYQREEGVTLFVHGIPEDRQEQFLNELQSFGFEGVKVAPETNIRDYKKEE
jgi:epidermal growth factor receptor substrate 15